MIKEYFANYFLHMSDITFDMSNNDMEVHQKNAEPWKITVVDTGDETMTGGRIKRVKDYIGDETFCCTYGDGLGELLQLSLIFISAWPPGHNYWCSATGALGQLILMKIKFYRLRKSHKVMERGLMVFSYQFFRYRVIPSDATVWEKGPLEYLAKKGELGIYKHQGFWRPMDTQRDRLELENLWDQQSAPWKTW